MPSFESVISALERHGVDYVLVGGLAVNLHGHQRLTADLDFVVRMPNETPEQRKSRQNANWARHERQQAEFIAQASTPEQRVAWVEQTIMELGPDRVVQMRDEAEELARRGRGNISLGA